MTAQQRRKRYLERINSNAQHSRRGGRRLVELPGHARETTDTLVGKLGERRRREVEREHVAADAAVGERDRDGLAFPCGFWT